VAFGTNLVREPKPKPLLRWSILILRAKAVWLGDVEAASEAEAITIGAEQFGQPKERLIAVKRQPYHEARNWGEAHHAV
jgi:hypothetical protein